MPAATKLVDLPPVRALGDLVATELDPMGQGLTVGVAQLDTGHLREA